MKIVLIDDHHLFRVGVRHILDTIPDCNVVGEASRARDAFALVDAERPDVVVLDVALPGMDGVVATRELRRRAPATRVLILTVHDQPRDVRDAFLAGAGGYALKSEEPAALVRALHAVMRDERYLAPALAARMSAHGAEPQPADVLAVLSEREKEIFRLAAECLMTREIARELCISRKTVDTHLYRIHHKLGLRTAAELVKLAAQLSLIHSGQVFRRPHDEDEDANADIEVDLPAPMTG